MTNVQPMANDPITAGFETASDLMLLIQKAIPSDEQRMQQLHQRSPIIYARIRRKWYHQCLTHLRFRWREDIDSWVDFTGGGFLLEERIYCKRLLHQTLLR